MMFAVKNGKIIFEDKIESGKTLLFTDKIEGIVSENEIPESAEIIDAKGDYGCGVKYFSQDAVIKLAPAAGIELDENLSPAEKLKVVQSLMAEGDERAINIYDTIGTYFGYAIAYYCEFYDIKQVLIMGRVASGEGGTILLARAKEVLEVEFPKLAKRVTLNIPDEKARRVGQSVAAASLPVIKNRR